MDNKYAARKIDDQYSVLKVLGDGLSGEVLLVERDGYKQALKFLKKVQLNVSREDALKNFKTEFLILKELNHPNIARILDFGYDERLEKFYFTSEYVSGGTIDKALAHCDFQMKEKILLQIFRSLNYLHSRAITHLDIKPQNILVQLQAGQEPTAKLIDFGLAGFGTSQKRVGTPAYMAPEAILGRPLDNRTDIYSLGVTCYRILTGVNPFVGKTLQETLELQKNQIPPPISATTKNVPEYWDTVIARMISKKPESRYSQIALAIRDLAYLSGGKIEVETSDTRLSYLPEKGRLVGREETWTKFLEIFSSHFSEHSNSTRVLVVCGETGTGKSRFLTEIKHHAQLHQIDVIVDATKDPHSFGKKQVLWLCDNFDSPDIIRERLARLEGRGDLIVVAVKNSPELYLPSYVLNLGSFSHADLRDYLCAVTGLPEVPDPVVKEILNRTHGNPLCVAEFVKELLKQDVFRDESGAWSEKTWNDIPINFNEIQIPNSMDSVLEMHLKKLSAQALKVLCVMALWNEPMTADSIASIIEVHIDPLQEVFLELRENDWILLNEEEKTYTLSNLNLILNFTERFFSSEECAVLHSKMSQLAQILGDDKKSLVHSGLSEADAAGAEKLYLAAQQYFAAHRYSTVIELCEKALKNLGGEHSEHLHVLFLQGESMRLAYKSDDAEKVFLYIVHKANKKQPKQESLIFDAYDRLILNALRMGKKTQTAEWISQAKNLLRSDTPLADRMLIENSEAYLAYLDNCHDGARDVFEKNHQAWLNQLAPQDRRRVRNNRLVDVLLMQRRYHQAEKVVAETLAHLDLKEPSARAAALYYAWGDISYRLTFVGEDGVTEDRRKQGIEKFSECEKIARQLSDYPLMYRAYNGIANFYYDDGKNTEAKDAYERAMRIARKSGDYEMAATISLNLANTYRKLGIDEDAFVHLTYAAHTLESIPDKKTHTILNLKKVYEKLVEFHVLHHHREKAENYFKKLSGLHSKNEFLNEKYVFSYYLAELRFRISSGEDEAAWMVFKRLQESAKSSDDLATLEKFKEEYPNYFTVKKERREKTHHPYTSLTENHMTTSISSDRDALSKIIQINTYLNSVHDFDQLLKMVLSYALDLSGAGAGFAVIIEKDGTQSVRASLNANDEDAAKMSQSVLERAIETGEIIHSSDASGDERFDEAMSVVINDIKSVLCLPITSKNKIVGALYLDQKLQTHAFQNVDLNLLRAFCDQVGMALENIKLVGELRAAKNRLEEKLKSAEDQIDAMKTLLQEENGILATKYRYDLIVSKSEKMHRIFKILDKITPTALAVFIHGESGTGKELIAKSIHYNHPDRSQKRFIAINCGAIPANLMESELFGHRTGSFTGATRDKKGMFEEANGGTLFLDEIGELPLDLQVKLLRVLQEGEVTRIGDTSPIKVDVRVVSASHCDLKAAAMGGRFREDLFYRLCQMRVDLPPLRERPEDIPVLVNHFVKKYAEKNKLDKVPTASSEFLKSLMGYEWPGNVRELENLVSVCCALCENNVLTLDQIPEHFGIVRQRSLLSAVSMNLASQVFLEPIASGFIEKEKSSFQNINTENQIPIDAKNSYDPSKTWEDYEKIILAKFLSFHQGKKKNVAEDLKIAQSTVYKKIEEWGLIRSDHPVFAESFVITSGVSLDEYVDLIFRAALKYHADKPYAAIRQLKVSQGYFYKVMKRIRSADESKNSEVHL